MASLEPPDLHHFVAAIGWLELGNPAEAEAELALIAPALQQNPEVLELRWAVCAEQRRWEEGLACARALVERAPERATGWLHQAYALRRVPGGGLQQAWEALLPAFEKFPKEPTIAFNLSCYACQLQQLEAARLWLERAAAVGDKEKIKQMALQDSDLEPLWEEIQKW